MKYHRHYELLNCGIWRQTNENDLIYHIVMHIQFLHGIPLFYELFRSHKTFELLYIYRITI